MKTREKTPRSGYFVRLRRKDTFATAALMSRDRVMGVALRLSSPISRVFESSYPLRKSFVFCVTRSLLPVANSLKQYCLAVVPHPRVRPP